MLVNLIVGGALAACITLAIRHIVKTKKAGGCVGCSGGAGCAHCAKHTHKPE